MVYCALWLKVKSASFKSSGADQGDHIIIYQEGLPGGDKGKLTIK